MNKSQKQTNKSAPKQRIINALIKRASLNNFTFPQIIRGSTPDLKAGATTSAAFAFFLNYPSYFRNDVGTIGQMTNTCSLLANDQKVNDEYKVLELRLGYIPLLQNSVPLASYTTATGNSGVTQVAPAFDGSAIVGLDLDDSANFTSLAKALNVQGVNKVVSRVGNRCQQWIQFPQVDPVEQQKWLNLGAIVPSPSSPPDPNNPSKLSSIKVYTGIATPASAYPLQNTTVGAFLAEWVVLLKGSYTLS